MKRLLCLLTLTFIMFGATAQNYERRWNLGLLGGTTEYEGDLGNKFLAFDKNTIKNTYTYGLQLNRYLNRSFDFGVMGTYGSWGYFENDQPGFKADMLNFDATIKYKFYNGYMLGENSLFQPYILAGIGIASFKGSNTKEGMDAPLIAGAGLNLRVSSVLSLGYQATYGYLIKSDERDLQPANGSNDAFLIHTIGLNFNLGKPADEDGDGVSDKKDNCPNTTSSAKVDKNGCPSDSDKDGVADYMDPCVNVAGTANGCPDQDKDGVADKDDQCAEVAGLMAMQGCPDGDSDGITDSKDNCPNVKGILELGGCPDSDGDGIKDSDDKCPDVKGVKAFEGCPDTDSDGITDSNDMCPNLKGPSSTNGCPDTDLDGVHDGIDKCANIAGIASNEGCPEVKKEVKLLFQKALQGIKFGTGKANIIASSYPILNAVAKVLNDNPTYKLLIGGHTDNIGSESSNMTLSQDRADAVAAYLIEKGIGPLRIAATGYGATLPVDDNKTVAGRTRNRRVELKVEFLETADANK